MLSVAGWELRVFIPLPATAEKKDVVVDHQQESEEDKLDVWRWLKRHKKSLNKTRKEKKKGKKKDKKKDKKKKKEEEDQDSEKEGKQKDKKKRGPVERRTDFYLHLAPCSLPPLEEERTADAEEDGEENAVAVARWVEEGCGLKLRGGPWGHQLELKVRTANAGGRERGEEGEDNGQGEMQHAGSSSSMQAERWVKAALPRVGGEEVVLPPRTLVEMVALNRAVGAAVADGGGEGMTVGGGWRGLVEAAGRAVVGLLRRSPEEEEAHDRRQVAAACKVIGRRLMIAAAEAAAAPACSAPVLLSSTDSTDPSSTSPTLPRSSPRSSSASSPPSSSPSVPLCGVWRVDKARRQRTIKWPCPARGEKETEQESKEGTRDGDGERRVELLVVEQTEISVYTYPVSEAQELPPEEPRGDFLSVCVEGGNPDVLCHFMSAFLSSLPHWWRPVVVGYPGWITRLARPVRDVSDRP